MSHLLLVEDDENLGSTLQERLIKEGYFVEWAQDLAGASAISSKKTFDLVLLDVGLPDGSGFEWAQKWKKEKSCPIVFVTAQANAEARLLGYEIGAEEFIPKPFHLRELLLRVKHVLQNHAPQQRVQVGERSIDFESRQVVMPNGALVPIGQKEFEILKLLVNSSPKVVSRDDILNHVWGEDRFPSHRTIDNFIVRLRQLLGDDASSCIRSVRGIGYQWVLEGGGA